MRNYTYAILLTYFGTLVLLLSQCQNVSTSETRKVVMNAASVSDDSDAQQDYLNAPVKSKMRGEHMKAFLVAYSAFKEDAEIPDIKKQIENYSVELREVDNSYFILFIAKRSKNERGMKGGTSELGKDVTYTIRKSDYQIISRLFYK